MTIKITSMKKIWQSLSCDDLRYTTDIEYTISDESFKMDLVAIRNEILSWNNHIFQLQFDYMIITVM